MCYRINTVSEQRDIIIMESINCEVGFIPMYILS